MHLSGGPSVQCVSIIIQPPVVKCLTKLWHPNISEEGEICLSLLRQNSIDGLGWAPTRKLKDVVWGLNSLFTVSIFLNIFFASSQILRCTVIFESIEKYVFK